MPNLRDYTREQILALPPGPELDALVHGIRGGVGYAPAYSKDVGLVGVMMVKLRPLWPMYCFGPSGKAFAVWGNGPLNHDNVIGPLEAPHVCALALVLAAWEKEKKQ